MSQISQIRTLAVERIGKVIGRASPEELRRLLKDRVEKAAAERAYYPMTFGVTLTGRTM